jgi:hypothetical protein
MKAQKKAWRTIRKNKAFFEGLTTVKHEIAEQLKKGVTPQKLFKTFRQGDVERVMEMAKKQKIFLKGVHLKRRMNAKIEKTYDVKATPKKEIVRVAIEKHLASNLTPTHVNGIAGNIFDFFGDKFAMTKRILRMPKFMYNPVVSAEYDAKVLKIQDKYLERKPSFAKRVVRPNSVTDAREFLGNLFKMRVPFVALLLDFCTGFKSNEETIEEALNSNLPVGALIQITLCARTGESGAKKSNAELLRNLIKKNGNFKYETIEGLPDSAYQSKGSKQIPIYSDTKGSWMYVCLIRKVK